MVGTMLFRTSKKPAKLEPLLLTTAPPAGIFSGVELPTEEAWVPVEKLSEGDELLTAMNGSHELFRCEIRRLDVKSSSAAAGQWPIVIPEGALGNSEMVLVAPGQRIIFEMPVVAELFETPCVSVKAENLIGYKGIVRARHANGLTHVRIGFETPQTLRTNVGLFFDMPCPRGRHAFMPLTDRQARVLLRRLDEADRQKRELTQEAEQV